VGQIRGPRRAAAAGAGARGSAAREAEWTPRRVARALETGRARELHCLTEHLLPVVHARVARVLVASPVPFGHLRAEVEDLTQEVFAHLFDREARILRRWSPSRGASLRNYVGLVAERRVRSLLRSGRWTRWREQPTEARALESRAAPVESPARRAAEQQCWERVVRRAEAQLSSQGLLMMDLLLLQQRPVAEVAETTGMTVGALYAWRSRLQKLMREVASELPLADPRTAGP
jgi:RNA polymerase sigma-70 factor (ECF subfamily)